MDEVKMLRERAQKYPDKAAELNSEADELYQEQLNNWWNKMIADRKTAENTDHPLYLALQDAQDVIDGKVNKQSDEQEQSDG